jgi:hypothetical protein
MGYNPAVGHTEALLGQVEAAESARF